MLGSVLITGGDKKTRQKRAWDLLAEYGFTVDVKGKSEALDKVSPDLLVVQKEGDKKSVGIAQAREIKNFLRERPFEKKVKAVLVEDAQAFTDDAQGSLLKILEEPPAFGLIILLADKEGSLLPTVVSRCQKLVIQPEKSKNSAKESAHSPVGGVTRRGTGSSEANSKSLYDLSACTYEELFDLAKTLSAKGKEEALDFLEEVLREDVKTGASLPVIQKLEQALKELKDANVALKFALEYLFLLHK